MANASTCGSSTGQLGATISLWAPTVFRRLFCRMVVDGSVRLGELEMGHASADVRRATFNAITAAIQQPI